MDPLPELENLVQLLSKFVFEEGIPIEIQREELTRLYKSYAKVRTFKNIGELVNLMHKIKGHSDSKVKLECGNNHCVECYFELAMEDMWDPNNACCTDGRSINPKYRTIIVNAHKRMQEMKRTCIVCDSKKDKMNFCLLSTHPGCVICTPCIRKKFNPREHDNACQNCNNQFDLESEPIIRSIVESDMNEEELLKIYSKNCPRCDNKRDSRGFQKTCAGECESCYNCIKDIIERKQERFRLLTEFKRFVFILCFKYHLLVFLVFKIFC
ncbi:hypothetical protein SteCoe_25257 [Stentor coeruleus]|uniref:Uncharacterized protein n=1 Tax=Stentor coeruleus TaxID=5963 RepID=A0A1R2BFK9_9CILI|nr:hypothetical protein SteCoe_25257 [Stentor coeruleus]